MCGVASNKDDDNPVIETVKKIIKERGIELSDYCIDQARRVGRKTKDDNYIESQPIIIRFQSFRELQMKKID